MKTQYQVVARNRIEAIYHRSIPRVGSIKGGYRVTGLTAKQVEGYLRWWLIQVQGEPLRISWRSMRPRRIKRWVKTLRAKHRTETK